MSIFISLKVKASTKEVKVSRVSEVNGNYQKIRVIAGGNRQSPTRFSLTEPVIFQA